MAVAIKPIRRRRRTAQRGKPISQSKRWGKVTTMTPTPEGQITSTETWNGQAPAKSAEELDAIIDAAIAAYDAEEVVQEVVQVLEEEQLPEEPVDDFDPEQV